MNYCSIDETCSKYKYVSDRRTIISEWDLVCDRMWLVSLTLSVYQMGYAVSGIIIGIFSDKYGRKKALILCVILETFSGISSALSSTIYQFIVCRFLMGIAGYGRYLACLLIRKSDYVSVLYFSLPTLSVFVFSYGNFW